MVGKDKLVARIANKNPFNIFIGIDVSKLKLDISVVMIGVVCTSFEVKNKLSGHKNLLKRIQKLPNYQLGNTLFCMESTAMYHFPIAEYLADMKEIVWVGNACQIKDSLGLVRGKDDKADTRKIGEYAYRHSDKFRPFEVAGKAFKQLEAIHKQRSKLLKVKYQLTLEIKEYKAMGMIELVEAKEEVTAEVLESIEKAMKKYRTKMKVIIHEDEELKKLYKLLTSMEGIDLLVGVHLIVATRAFKRFTNARKFACQIGIAPFEYQSGSSLKKKKGTSHFADRLGKKMITNAMENAMGSYGGLKSYYDQKIKEGKPAGHVLNACKNKLLHRIFTVIKSGKPYDKFYEWQPKKAS